MELIVRELDTIPFYQQFTPLRNLNVVAIRPHIYKHNNPSGNIKLQILDEFNFLIKESETVPISLISTEDFFHGYVRFFINMPLQEGVNYKLGFATTGGYSFSETDYIGLCSDYDLQKANRTYVSGFGAIDFELWIRE